MSDERKSPIDNVFTMPRVALFVGKGIVSPCIIEDIALALKQLKCSVDLIPLNMGMDELKTTLASSRPDLILGLDAKGLNYAPVLESTIQRVAWFVDNPFYFKELNALSKDDVIFVWDEDYISDLKAFGFTHVHFLPLGTNPQRFSAMSLSHETHNEYACEVSFVGTVGKTAEALSVERHKTYPLEVNRLVDKMVNMVVQGYDRNKYYDVLEGIKAVEKNMDYRARSLVQFLVDAEVNAVKRHELVKSLSNFKTKVYGDASDHLCMNDPVELCPPVDYRHTLAKVFKASTINLNITRPQLRTTVNQRIFDVFACGGFLLTDYRPYLDSVVPFPAERITFNNKDDLLSKISYYLEHKDERNELVLAAQNVVQRHHTYLHRMEELVSVMKPMLHI